MKAIGTTPLRRVLLAVLAGALFVTVMVVINWLEGEPVSTRGLMIVTFTGILVGLSNYAGLVRRAKARSAPGR